MESWAFSVRHYENDAEQSADTKYEEREDPSRNGGKGKEHQQHHEPVEPRENHQHHNAERLEREAKRGRHREFCQRQRER